MKLFKDVPKADLEMLFPNIETRMRARDWLLLLAPALFGGVTVVLKAAVSLGIAATLVWALARNELAALEGRSANVALTPEQGAALAAACMALFGIAGFVTRQWLSFKNRKIFFMKTLADSLYFRNLDNNRGVLHHLVDEAEEEESKEALLAYYFLLRSPLGLTESALDDTVESWLENSHGTKIDFEVEDGLGKLERLGLVRSAGASPEGAPVWRALEQDEACQRLDTIWDGLFTYTSAQRGSPGPED